ncbi:pyridine nucleotide-disulfide oxidoreductase [Pontibacillus halophilus JSM 076056 = DSM 19796]|uniref:Pyridine nucleotide-disulfide oxidoreductase n=1 Tax=Pontibacillus halophilus JSM 076056 = DSM 19796 TaxID=1385510 RepID=A0A0A5GHY6_9BACI|nr:NAD(P)/FAD-dependent oxidoreductase [Pontibacillus halophilus]KGX91609.1 pyridine nucleotide-disulfide oxidoreductase [Pontibacillus halophilus JSM 076056 = DSM 19796]
MSMHYDLLVIGTGVAGTSAAVAAADENKSVAIIDERPYGGTCPNRGCDPKKVMVGISQLYEQTKNNIGHGINGEVTLNWKDLKTFKDTFTHPVPESRENMYKEKGIHTYHSKGVLKDSHTVQAGSHTLTGDSIFIATGAKPSGLPIDGAEHLYTSDQFFELEDLPPSIVFIGGGYISMEFAHLARAAGSEVVVFERSPMILSDGFDYDVKTKLKESSEAKGIIIHTETNVTSIKQHDGMYTVEAKKDGRPITLEADLVVHGAGRTPNIENMGLDEVGISYTKQGIVVDSTYQTYEFNHIYAAGDCAYTNELPLTPVAGQEGSRAIEHLLYGTQPTTLPTHIPSIVFTYPPLASVGATEEQLKKLGTDYDVLSKDLSGFFTYKRTNESTAYSKVLTDKSTGKLLGVHLLNSYSEHLINLFTLAIEKGMTKEEVKALTFVYPSAESDVASLFS